MEETETGGLLHFGGSVFRFVQELRLERIRGEICHARGIVGQ